MNNRENRPPRVAEWLLSMMDGYDCHYSSCGDFKEMFNHMCKNEGRARARRWYWFQVLMSFWPYFIYSFNWRLMMFKNYLKIAVRHILRQKMFSFINITGLALGMASFILITIWVLNELSYNKFHDNADRIYNIFLKSPKDGRTSGHTTPIRLAHALKEEIPEIIDFVRCDKRSEALFMYKDKGFYESKIYGVDPSFFKMFGFPLIQGDKNTVLDNLQSIVISESLAKKYFGEEDPIGKALRVNGQVDLFVTGIFRDVPENSSLKFEILIPFDLVRGDWRERDWKNWFGGEAFVMLQDKNLDTRVNNKISDFLIKKAAFRESPLVTIQPLTEIHISEVKKYLYIFSASALFILIIACINFINLSTARSSRRAKEIGMRKITGASRKSIIKQFLGESFLLAVISLMAALILVVLLMPLLSSITGKAFSPASTFNQILILLIPLVITTGIAAGAYPALFISGFQPVRIIKGDFKSGSGGSPLRRILVVIQFTLSILLIFGTCVVHKQIMYIKSKNIGYDKEQVVRISMRGNTRRYFDALKNELSVYKNITDITGISQDLPHVTWVGDVQWPDKDPNKNEGAWALYVDYDFIKTMKIELIEGRDFNNRIAGDSGPAYIINEELLKQMEMESAVGKPLTFWKGPGRIIGVVKNFHFQSLYREIDPMVIMLSKERISAMLIRIRPENINSTLKFIGETWKRAVPGVPFLYTFLDEDFYQVHKEEENTGKLIISFSILAILTGCLGLFGLVSFTAELRTKEIGIRKVFGSSIPGIVILLLKEFTNCILIANMIALPIAYYVTSNWIQKFAYRTSIGIDIVIFSATLAIIIAIATVSFQAIKAARSNLVNSLRYE